MRRACDRCYRVKQKCYLEASEDQCTACKDSNSLCRISRVEKRAGRRPTERAFCTGALLRVWDPRSSRTVLSESKWTALKPNSCAIAPGDAAFAKDLLAKFRILFDGEPFETSPELLHSCCETYGPFMHGQSFAASFRNSFQRAFFSAPELVKDTFPALQSAMLLSQQKHSPLAIHESTTKGVSAVETLRNAKVRNADDAFAVIALGQTLAAFDLMTNSSGARLILQYSLASAEPFYSSVSATLDTEPVTVTSIIWDTVCCLVNGEVPSIKYQPRGPDYVDRVAGLCTTLLPLLYDLSKANVINDAASTSVLEDRQLQLLKLEKDIASWKPSRPKYFNTRFTEQEIVQTKAQAALYQQAALLVLHRISHPLGPHDEVAEGSAKAIVTDIIRFSSSPGHKFRLRHIIFPILVAALELEDFPNWIWDTQEILRLAPACRRKLLGLVDFVWTQRRSGSEGSFTQLIRRGPSFVMLP